MKIVNWLRKFFSRKDSAFGTIKLADLKMTLYDTFTNDPPHEVSIYVPRVEIREKVQTILFTKSREIIYNSITIVDAPRHPLAGEGSTKVIPSPTQQSPAKNPSGGLPSSLSTKPAPTAPGIPATSTGPATTSPNTDRHGKHKSEKKKEKPV